MEEKQKKRWKFWRLPCWRRPHREGIAFAKRIKEDTWNLSFET